MRTNRAAAVRRFLPLALLLCAGLLFLTLGGRHFLSFTALAEHRLWLTRAVAESAAVAALIFIAAYAAMAALSIPGAAILTITGGFLFGPWLGTAYAIVAATLGATIVFLAARAGLAGLAARAGPWAARLEAGFRRNSLSYLLVLRLIPVIPFWLINLAAGALGLPVGTFILGTFVGMIPVTFIYTSLGNGLGAVIAKGRAPDASVLFRPDIILPMIGLAVLALLPVAYKRWRGQGGKTPA